MSRKSRARAVARRSGLPLFLALTAVATLAPASSASGVTSAASVSSGGVEGNGNSASTQTAGSGRYVVFESNASNLVPGDTNAVSDIFLRDRATGQTYRVSVGNNGQEANGPSHSARGVSPNGRYVVFESFASNLVKGDTNGTWDVFLRDRSLGRTYRISVNSKGVQGNGPSADPVVSAKGRYVAYESSASNLTSNDTNGAITDVFLRDRSARRTILVSVSSSGKGGNGSSSDPSISTTGRYVAFESLATTLVRKDTNLETDIFVRDLATKKTDRVSVNSRGVQGNAGSHSSAITPNGRYVAFESFSSNLGGTDTNHVSDVFLRDRAARKTYRVSVSSSGKQGNGYSSDPSISDDGRYVAFESAATNFVAGDTNARVDAFVRDRVARKTTCLSLTPGGQVGNAAASDPSLSADGKFVAFEAEASDLVGGDTNGHTDVFVRGPLF
jgi:Tol biopolymer transport system component